MKVSRKDHVIATVWLLAGVFAVGTGLYLVYPAFAWIWGGLWLMVAGICYHIGAQEAAEREAAEGAEEAEEAEEAAACHHFRLSSSPCLSR